MTKKVNQTPLLKFSKITDEKVFNVTDGTVIEKAGSPAGKKS